MTVTGHVPSMMTLEDGVGIGMDQVAHLPLRGSVEENRDRIALLARSGDPAEAARRFVAIIEHWLELGNRTHQLTTLRNLIGLLLRIGAPAAGAELVGALTAGASVPTYGEEAARIAGWEDDIRAAIGDAETERRAATGRGRTVEEAARAAIVALSDLAG